MITKIEKVVLKALKKEYARLLKASLKAREEADECIAIGSEVISIHEEFKSIIESKMDASDALERISKLQKRRDRANKTLEKDIVSLTDKQIRLEGDINILADEIARIELRAGLYENN